MIISSTYYHLFDLKHFFMFKIHQPLPAPMIQDQNTMEEQL